VHTETPWQIPKNWGSDGLEVAKLLIFLCTENVMIIVKKINQLDVTECFIALMIRPTCFGISMTIIRSSRLYVCYCRLWCAVLGCWLSGIRCRAAG